MILGRFIFGLGGEAIGITANLILVKWFNGKELSFANSITLSVLRSATVLNTMISPVIAEVHLVKIKSKIINHYLLNNI
jgi:hypothetical protein